MTIKERETLFKIHEAMKKLTTPPQTTNTGLTGQVNPPNPYGSGTTPLPLLNVPKPQG